MFSFSKHDKQVVFLFHFNDSLDKRSHLGLNKADRCFCLMRFIILYWLPERNYKQQTDDNRTRAGRNNNQEREISAAADARVVLRD